MRCGAWKPTGSILAAAGLVLAGLGAEAGRADEPGSRLGRLLRLGGGNSAPRKAESPTPKPSATPANPSASLPRAGAPNGNPYGPAPAPFRNPGPIANSVPNEVGAGSTVAPANRLRPQPRNSHSVTEADPWVTRIALTKADDGKTYGMFMQVYADGTVIDSEGVHRVGADVMKPLAEALQNPDLGRVEGHCGGPPTDFIEQVHVVVYERYRGKLRANSFSFSGNPAGCDPSVKVLHQALDAVQSKVAGPATTAAVVPSVTTPAASVPPASTTPPAPPTISGPVLELTPGN